MKNAQEVGDYTLDALQEIMTRHPSIGEVRGKGLMIGVEFVSDKQTKEPSEEIRDRVVDNSFKTGLLLLGCGKSTIRIAPPLSVTKNEVDEALLILEEAITSSEKELLQVAS